MGALLKSKTELVKNVSKIMIETFTKLLPINIVAKSLCGFCNKCNVLLSGLTSVFSISSIVCGSSEKKATSDAEIIAESNKSNRLTTSAKMPDKLSGSTVMAAKVICKESVSNYLKN